MQNSNNLSYIYTAYIIIEPAYGIQLLMFPYTCIPWRHESFFSQFGTTISSEK